MKCAWVTTTVFVLVACGGEDHHRPKTPQEWIEEQERIAMEEQAENDDDDFMYADVETDDEKEQKFDEEQAEMELKRATRNAESCPAVVAEQEGEKPRGELSVAITFEEDGTVSDVSIPSPFDETPIGNCIRRAYTSVIVPPFIGGQQIKHWDLEIKDPEETAEGNEGE